MIVFRRYNYRLYPTKEQEQTLIQFAGCRRFVWNWALRRKQEYYKATGKGLKFTALAAELVQLKQQPQFEWLRDCCSQVLIQVLMDLQQAYVNFFQKRARFPREKHRKSTPHSMRFPHLVTLNDDQTVYVPKIGPMGVLIHRPVAGIIKNMTIKQEPKGAWHVSFVCAIERPDYVPTCDNPVGIDVGLESFTTLDTGCKVKAPRFYRRGERKLKRLHRRLSRAKKGSQNRQKARKRLARA